MGSSAVTLDAVEQVQVVSTVRRCVPACHGVLRRDMACCDVSRRATVRHDVASYVAVGHREFRLLHPFFDAIVQLRPLLKIKEGKGQKLLQDVTCLLHACYTAVAAVTQDQGGQGAEAPSGRHPSGDGRGDEGRR